MRPKRSAEEEYANLRRAGELWPHPDEREHVGDPLLRELRYVRQAFNEMRRYGYDETVVETIENAERALSRIEWALRGDRGYG